MFPFALSIFDTGLLIIVVILVLLYLIVLIKLKPSTGGEKIAGTKPIKQNVRKAPPTERRNNLKTCNEHRKEPADTGKAVEGAKYVPTASKDVEKPVFLQDNQSAGCPHRLGYLKEHPKHTPIPNECLTCTKIMECLAGAE